MPLLEQEQLEAYDLQRERERLEQRQEQLEQFKRDDCRFKAW